MVYVGIILTSTGAALNNISSAPQVIRAIAEDDMLPRVFNFLKGDHKKSLYFTGALITCSISFGSLN